LGTAQYSQAYSHQPDEENVWTQDGLNDDTHKQGVLNEAGIV